MKALWYVIVQLATIFIVWVIPVFIYFVLGGVAQFFGIVLYGGLMMCNGTFGQRMLERLYEKMTKEEFKNNPFY